jgi:hypothetical protein
MAAASSAANSDSDIVSMFFAKSSFNSRLSHALTFSARELISNRKSIRHWKMIRDTSGEFVIFQPTRRHEKAAAGGTISDGLTHYSRGLMHAAIDLIISIDG